MIHPSQKLDDLPVPKAWLSSGRKGWMKSPSQSWMIFLPQSWLSSKPSTVTEQLSALNSSTSKRPSASNASASNSSALEHHGRWKAQSLIPEQFVPQFPNLPVYNNIVDPQSDPSAQDRWNRSGSCIKLHGGYAGLVLHARHLAWWQWIGSRLDRDPSWIRMNFVFVCSGWGASRPPQQIGITCQLARLRTLFLSVLVGRRRDPHYQSASASPIWDVWTKSLYFFLLVSVI